MKYCESNNQTIRRQTRCVMVGNVGVGGNNPIRIQSMTTSSTRDVAATVEQVIRLADAGCEIVRVTVQGIKEAEACEEIKNTLIQKNYLLPIVADIHFFPPAAMRVADFVDKIRVNPGNYADKRAQFKVIEYDDLSYAEELVRIEEKFTPLVLKCKELKRAMRIGTNHGSLSDRIMNRYGDTPRGMVESALEFARICRKNDYHDFIFSMKSSNPQVMILAYRLLVAEMYALGWDYPLHLGVTEAGEGEDGRIKSAMGIGSLLLDGIGDTIRVSLTEDAWNEIDPCKRLNDLAATYTRYQGALASKDCRVIDDITRREVIFPKDVAMHKEGTVYVTLSEKDLAQSNLYTKLGCDTELNRPKIKRSSVDGVVVDGPHKCVNELSEVGIGVVSKATLPRGLQLMTVDDYRVKTMVDMFSIKLGQSSPVGLIVTDEDFEIIEQVKPAVIFLAPKEDRLHGSRRVFNWLAEKRIQTPVILSFTYQCSKEDLVIHAAAECGGLLCDGLGDGLWLQGDYDYEFLRTLSLNILQAARRRTIKTDFISCPSCGRTLFDLQDVTRRIKSRTAHLPGVKIAIMGCIVNGPGEMADADFGYVGSKPGMIDLYIGKKCVEKDIPFAEADDRLIELIKSHGKWEEAPIMS
jgi:(E)-4-hydroxy-3-methylbut-2-enyl-diphosphate synthase